MECEHGHRLMSFGRSCRQMISQEALALTDARCESGHLITKVPCPRGARCIKYQRHINKLELGTEEWRDGTARVSPVDESSSLPNEGLLRGDNQQQLPQSYLLTIYNHYYGL